MAASLPAGFAKLDEAARKTVMAQSFADCGVTLSRIVEIQALGHLGS